MSNELKAAAIIFSVLFFSVILFVANMNVPPGYVEPQPNPSIQKGPVYLSKFEHNGHSYLILLGCDRRGQYGFCHDPDCNCGAK